MLKTAPLTHRLTVLLRINHTCSSDTVYSNTSALYVQHPSMVSNAHAYILARTGLCHKQTSGLPKGCYLTFLWLSVI